MSGGRSTQLLPETIREAESRSVVQVSINANRTPIQGPARLSASKALPVFLSKLPECQYLNQRE